MTIKLLWYIIEAPTLEFSERRIMDNTTIKIKVQNRVAFCEGNGEITSMNTGDKVVFEFDKEWNPESQTETRTARFIKGNSCIDIPFNGNVCVLPAYKDYGNVYIGVFWGDIKTTTMAKITVNTSIASEFDFAENPPNDVYNQILEVLSEKVNQTQLQQAVEKALTETYLIEESEAFLNLKPEISRYHLLSGASVGISCEDFSRFPLGYCATITFYNPYAPSLLESFKIETEILKDYSDNGLPLSELKIGVGTKGTILFIYKTDHGNKFGWYLSTADKQLNKEHIDDSVKDYLSKNPLSDGYTPQREIDYWTLEDREQIQTDNMSFITEELAKRGQLKPEFANSIDDCVDTTKLYVLPDGYIYGYIKTTETIPPYTNKVPMSKDGNGAIYNGNGYKEGYRLNSSGTETALNGAVCSGFIPMTKGDIIYILSDASNPSNTAHYFDTYDSSFAKLSANGGGNLGEWSTLDGRYLWTIDTSVLSVTPTYFRCATYSSGVDFIVSVNEPLDNDGKTVITYALANTGHAFVPADYEDRIISLEDEVFDLKNISTSSNGAPLYVIEEAERVADKILAVRNAHSLVFGAVSDLHTTGSDISATSVLHAGMGMDAVNGYTQLDLILNFGDVMVGYLDDTYKEGFKQVKSAFHSVSKAVLYIQMQGNHDQISSDTTEQASQKYFAYIGANNKSTHIDYENLHRNYGYMDFDNQKIRVIYLNTADVSDGDITSDCWISEPQIDWFINTALDFRDKPDWSFIVCSHHPLNWSNATEPLLSILDGYKGKSSGSITINNKAVYYDFTEATAELIAHFHGHLHNFRAEQLGSNGLWTITIPNACYDRNNEYGTASAYSEEIKAKYGDTDENGNQRQFNKTFNSQKDTAFNAVVVDKQNRKIYCFNYGAGIDREITY